MFRIDENDIALRVLPKVYRDNDGICHGVRSSEVLMAETKSSTKLDLP